MSEAIAFEDVRLWFPQVQTRPKSLKEAFYARLRGTRPDEKTSRFYALDGVSFAIQSGEVVGLLGKNGSGKSTILKVLSGIYRADEGRVRTQGRISSLLELGAGFREELTGWENVRLNGAILGFSPAEIDARAPEIVEYSELGDFVYQPLRTYSSGMKVRLGFAIAQAIDPQILLIDEVLGVGDEQFKRKSLARIEAMVSSGCTIVIVSHNLVELERLCRRLVLVHRGRSIGEGPPKEIIERYKREIVG